MSVIFNAKLLKKQIEMEGMIAENQYRISLGHQIAYSEDSFQILISEIDDLIKQHLESNYKRSK